MAEPLNLKGVRVEYRTGSETFAPVAGVDLVLRAGEIVAIGGPSGSGKSTLLQVAAGFTAPSEGSVHWGVSSVAPPPWADVAVVPQSLGLLPELTARENIAAPILTGRRQRTGSLHQAVGAAHDLVATLLEALDLGEFADRLVREASLGQQQRVAVARALVLGSALVVADEPTSHQDGDHADVVLAAFRRAAANGSAILMAGHDNRLAAAADRTGHLEGGMLVLTSRDGELDVPGS